MIIPQEREVHNSIFLSFKTKKNSPTEIEAQMEKINFNNLF